MLLLGCYHVAFTLQLYHCYSRSPVTQKNDLLCPREAQKPGFDLAPDPAVLTTAAALAVPLASSGGPKADSRCCPGPPPSAVESQMGHNPHPSPTYHLLGCPGIVLHPLYRHDAAFQVCPAANSPLQRLGHLVREDMSLAEASQRQGPGGRTWDRPGWHLASSPRDP